MVTHPIPDREIPAGQGKYEVGYCKPPVSGQFKKGESGNPKGRKRKPKSLRGEVEALMSSKVSVAVGGEKKLLHLRQVLARALVSKAGKGDPRSLQMIINILKEPESSDPQANDLDGLTSQDKAMLDELLAHLTDGGDDTSHGDVVDTHADQSALDRPDPDLEAPGYQQPEHLDPEADDHEGYPHRAQ